MSTNKRPRFNEPGHTKDDALRDSTALARAVMKGPDDIEEFYKQRGGAAYTAEALAVACRFGGLETVQALLSHGATFRAPTKWKGIKDRPFSLMVLANTVPIVRRKVRRQIPPEERLEMVRLLYSYGEGDFSEILYQAILGKEFEIADELLSLGVTLSPDRITLLTGSAGFVNDSQNVSRSDRMVFRRAIRNASDLELMGMIDRFLHIPEVDLVAVYDLDICDIEMRRGGSKTILPRFENTDLLIFMLEKTTMRKVVTRRMLVELVVDNNDVKTFEWMLANGLLNRQTEISMMFDVLEDAASQHPEIHALAVAHRSAHQPKKDGLSIPTNPFAASVMRQTWKYESCGEDGKEVRITKYKAESKAVSIPPQIGRRKVTEILPEAFVQTAPGNTGRTRRYYYGANVTRTSYTSVSFPGTIRIVPQCFSPRYNMTDAQEVLLQEGITEIAEDAFAGSSIRSISIPESVVRIGQNAFEDCAKLKSVQLPSQLDTLPSDVFSGCSSLRTVSGLSHLSVIGDNAFQKTALETADISGAIKIGQGVFAYCARLRKANLPPRMSVIPDHFFHGCASITAIPDHPNLTGVGNHALADTGIEKLCIGAVLKDIGSFAFADCKRLTYVRLDSSRTHLPDGIFQGCTSLVDIKLPESLEVIGRQAFLGCKNLEAIEFNETLTGISERAFSETGLRSVRTTPGLQAAKEAFAECSSLTSVFIDASFRMGDGAFSKCSSLKTVIIERGTPRIASNAFAHCTSLHEIELPDTVSVIENGAFRCSGLRHLELPETGEPALGEDKQTLHVGDDAFRDTQLSIIHIPAYTSIGSRAFSECGELTQAHISAGASCKDNVFSACRSLSLLVLDEGATIVPDAVCRNCRALHEVRLPGTTTEIGSEAFKGSGITQIELPEGLLSIKARAFAGSSLERIVIPASVRHIGKGAFSGCLQLKEVVFSGSPECIESHAFENCRLLRHVVLPFGLSSIGRLAFKESGLESVDIPDSLTIIPIGLFRGCSSLRQVHLGSSIQKIAEDAFMGCSSLGEIELPDSLEEIDARAFAKSGLVQITVPPAVSDVRARAFANCHKLKTVVIEGGEHTTLSKKAFFKTRTSVQKQPRHTGPPLQKT